MTPETIKCLCELDSNNHLQPGESIEAWYERLTQVAIGIAKHTNSFPETLAILAKDFDDEVSSIAQEQLKKRKKVSK